MMQHRISGYLTAKTPDDKKTSLVAFSRRKSKQEWLVLDEVSMKLLAFNDEDSANRLRKDPMYTVPLAQAVFQIESSEENTFSITSNKKYIYQAKSHTSMLIWLACLQSCRAVKLSEGGEGSNGSSLVLSSPPITRKTSDTHLLRSESRDYTFMSANTGQSIKRQIPPTVSETHLDSSYIDGNGSLSSNSTYSSPYSPTAEAARFFGSQNLQLQEAQLRETLLRRMISVKEGVFDAVEMPSAARKGSVSGSDNSDFSPTVSTNDENLFLKAELLQAQATVKSLNEMVERQNTEKLRMEGEHLNLQNCYTSLLQRFCTNRLDGTVEHPNSTKFAVSETHRSMVESLLLQARLVDPRLPSFKTVEGNQCHTDAFGFIQSFSSEDHLFLYMISRLKLHYSISMPEKLRLAQQWIEIINSDFQTIPKAKLKTMCRMGIPMELRERVWSKLVYMGVSKSSLECGPRYYQRLVEKVNDMKVDYTHRRQITLDVLRTFPDHVAFSRPESAGIQQMQEVLQAFALHNPEVGYCQGMNFIAGNGSLLLDKETTFWLMVLFVEQHFSVNYFNAGLVAAQADQAVMRELIGRYSPNLFKLLDELEVDMTTITFNWFMAVFVGSVPIETVMRVWDVFLLEGMKTLFRVSLALLLSNEENLLKQSDTLAIWKCMKSAALLVYDADELMSASFKSFKMIKHKELKSKREEVCRRLSKCFRQNSFLSDHRYSTAIAENQSSDAQVESRFFSAAPLGSASAAFLVFYADNGKCGSKLGNAEDDKIYNLEVQFESPILCVTCLKEKYLILGTADGNVYSFNSELRYKMWELKLVDRVTAMAVSTSSDGTSNAFIGLDNGGLVFVENITPHSRPRDHFTMFLGVLAISSIVVFNEQVWCACGSVLEIFDVSTLDHLKRIQVAENPLNTVLCMASCDIGVWVSMCGSTVLQLWSTTDFKLVTSVDVRKHFSESRKNAREPEEALDRITAVLCRNFNLFVGTGSGTIFIYKILTWKSKSRTTKPGNLHSEGQPEHMKPFDQNLSRMSISYDDEKSFRDDAISLSGKASPVHSEQQRESNLSNPIQINLLLSSRCQVTESPIRAFVEVRSKQGSCIISFSEKSTEDDAILKWTLSTNKGTQWTNCPILEVSLKNSTVVLPGYMRNPLLKMGRLASIDISN